MKDSKKCPRREVDYDTLERMLGDVDRLAAADAPTTGNWSKAQIFRHLATTFDKSVDGFGFKAAWPIRLVCKFLRRRFLTQKMPAGIQLRNRAAEVLLPEETDVPSAQEHLHSAVGRFHAATNLAEHPALGSLTRDEWNLLHLRHCELHMSFIANP